MNQIQISQVLEYDCYSPNASFTSGLEADKCPHWKLDVYMLKHHSVKPEYLMCFFAELANSLVFHMVNKASRERGFLDFIANKYVVKVMKTSLMGWTRAILRSITMKNTLTMVRYVYLDIVQKADFSKIPKIIETLGINQKEAGLKRDWEVQSGIINILENGRATRKNKVSFSWAQFLEGCSQKEETGTEQVINTLK